MPTNTRTAGGTLWSEVAYWDQGHVPIAGEDVALGAQTVAIDVPRVPATSGSLGTITATTGKITIDLTTNGATELNATVITPGSVGAAFIDVTGATNNFTLNATTLNGGATTGNICINFNATSTATITVTNITGGGNGTQVIKNVTTGTCNIIASGTALGATAGGGSFCINNYSTGTMSVTAANITGNYTVCVNNTSTGPLTIVGATITGGTATFSSGVTSPSIAPTFTNVRLVNGTKAIAYSGYPPVWTPAITDYQTWGAVEWVSVTALTAANIKAGIVSGTVAGTLSFKVDGITVKAA